MVEHQDDISEEEYDSSVEEEYARAEHYSEMYGSNDPDKAYEDYRDSWGDALEEDLKKSEAGSGYNHSWAVSFKLLPKRYWRNLNYINELSEFRPFLCKIRA